MRFEEAGGPIDSRFESGALPSRSFRSRVLKIAESETDVRIPGPENSGNWTRTNLIRADPHSDGFRVARPVRLSVQANMTSGQTRHRLELDMKIRQSLFIAYAAFVPLLAAANSSADTSLPRPTADIRAWPRMTSPTFGCYVETAFGYRDKRFNCALKQYRNTGDACKNTKAYYEAWRSPTGSRPACIRSRRKSISTGSKAGCRWSPSR